MMGMHMPGMPGMMPPPLPGMVCCVQPESRKFQVRMKLTEGGKLTSSSSMLSPGGSWGRLVVPGSHEWDNAVGWPFFTGGYESLPSITTRVTPGINNLKLEISVSLADSNEKAGTFCEGRTFVRKSVKDGETVTIPCDHLVRGKVVRCVLKATVSEVKADNSVRSIYPHPVAAPCCSPTMTTASVPCREIVKTKAWVAPPATATMPCCGTVQAASCIPPVASAPVCVAAPLLPPPAAPVVKKSTPTTIRVIDSTKETDAHFVGKMCDVQPPAKLLEIRCGDTTFTCEKTELKSEGCETVTVAVVDGQVGLRGTGIKAIADRVMSESGQVTLEGHVRLKKTGSEVDVETGKVKFKLEQETQIDSFHIGFLR
jgi:hypothetical protein